MRENENSQFGGTVGGGEVGRKEGGREYSCGLWSRRNMSAMRVGALDATVWGNEHVRLQWTGLLIALCVHCLPC